MRLSHELMTLSLRRPFASNRGVITSVRHVIVRLAYDGRVGLGTAVVAHDRAGVEGIRAELDDYAPRLAHLTPEQALAELGGVTPSARAAIDVALHDLVGKLCDVPLHRLWGVPAPTRPTAISIGELPEEDRLARARELADWPILKLKLTASSDVGIVGKLRAFYAGRIWIDGNGAWSPEQAVMIAEELDRHGVELLEQPIRAGSLDALRFVHERSPVPIVADEDCVGPSDVARLAGCVDAINIKLVKCGGLTRAREMIGAARRLGLRVMLGCKTESALGVTAMAQLAGLADYLDLDGALELADDPFSGVTIDRGTLALPTGPGLGVVERLDEPATVPSRPSRVRLTA